MKTLVIDSATEACSVALFHDGNLVAGDWRLLGRGHAELLVPMIAALPDKGRAERIIVARGPGSFTGLRVGLAAARALALAWNVPLAGYPTCALIAAQARADAGPAAVTVAMTGGHGEWFVADYAPDGHALAAVTSLSPDAAAARGGAELVAGSQAEALVDMRGSGRALKIWPDARAAMLLTAGDTGPDTSLIYGRAPDARLPGSAA